MTTSNRFSDPDVTGVTTVVHYPPVMFDAHVLEWRYDHYRSMGVTDNKRGAQFTEAEREMIDNLRPTHTLKEIGKILGGRHPSTISDACRVRADMRARNGNPRGVLA